MANKPGLYANINAKQDRSKPERGERTKKNKDKKKKAK
jgi:hypothetical protein